jgi:integrase
MANKQRVRRGHGDGSIYQRESDGLWVGYARLETGKRRYVYSKTRVEVAQKLKALQKDIDTRTVVTARSETVESYLKYWIGIRQGRRDIKPSTVASYRHHLAPCMQYIGHVKLTKLTPDTLQTMCNALLGKRKPSTVHAMLTILNTAFNDAIRWQRLGSNPCKSVMLPQAEKHEGPVLTGEQAQSLLTAAKGHRLEGFIHLALATGLRKGELLGLKWSDIDMETRLLKVSRNAAYLPDDTGHYRMSEGTPKSRAGKRSIRLPQFAVNALKEQKVRQLEQRLQAGSAWTDTGLIFSNHRGTYYSLSALDSQFKRLVAGAGLPAMRIHDLRHSAATLLLKMGVDMKVIQEILGHASYHITANTYSHVLMEMQDAAMDKMDGLFLSAK